MTHEVNRRREQQQRRDLRKIVFISSLKVLNLFPLVEGTFNDAKGGS